MVLFRSTPSHLEIVITWCYRKAFYIVFPPCKVSNPTKSILLKVSIFSLTWVLAHGFTRRESRPFSIVLPYLHGFTNVVDSLFPEILESKQETHWLQIVLTFCHTTGSHWPVTDRFKPGSYLLRMRIWSACDVNYTTLLSQRYSQVSWTQFNSVRISLRICDVNIRIAFAFAGSMNRAL